MGTKERRIAERDQIRKKIFDAASGIIIEEGFEKLSIRKIADRIEYSPGVIYNYFKDKNEIVERIIAENIQRICDSVLSLDLAEMNPKEALKLGLTRFAAAMLENRQQYKAIMLSGMHASMFREDNSETGRLRELLVQVLRNGNESGIFQARNEEVTAMLLIASVFGLLNTLVQEKIEDPAAEAMFIESQTEILVRGVSVHSYTETGGCS
jgi:AcrR family transcriptional regulator